MATYASGREGGDVYIFESYLRDGYMKVFDGNDTIDELVAWLRLQDKVEVGSPKIGTLTVYDEAIGPAFSRKHEE